MLQSSDDTYFEDMIWLFSSNKMSRGIVRLNIAEGALLFKYCKKVRDGQLLEIGRKYGGSTALMASALKNGHLYSIDCVLYSSVCDYIASYKDKITLITANTISKKMQWERNVDLIFFDGGHTRPVIGNDIKKFTPYVAPNGYAIFHDMLGKKVSNWSLISRMLKKEWIRIDDVDSMLILQKKIE